jgi:hypothetical protein
VFVERKPKWQSLQRCSKISARRNNSYITSLLFLGPSNKRVVHSAVIKACQMMKPIGAIAVQDCINAINGLENQYVIANHVSVVCETMFKFSSNTRR